MIHGFRCCATCISSSGTVVEPMTFHVSTVKVSLQGVYAPATFLSCVVAGFLFMRLVIPALQVCNSVLDCLALHAFLVVSKLMP